MVSAADEPPMALNMFVKAVGVSVVTVWRWRRAGFIDVVHIAGNPYVTREEIRRFNARLKAGEFAGTINNPAAHRKASM